MVMGIFRSSIMLLFITLLFMASLTVRPSITYACSCVAGMTVEPLEALEKNSAVFVGKVVAIKEPKRKEVSITDYAKVTFEVDSSWKGVEGDKFSLVTAIAGCGYMFTEGKSYLVYAGKMDSGKLGVSMCSETKLLSSAGKDLKELGPSISMGRSTATREPLTLVNVGISGVIVVLIAIIVAVLYRRKK